VAGGGAPLKSSAVSEDRDGNGEWKQEVENETWPAIHGDARGSARRDHQRSADWSGREDEIDDGIPSEVEADRPGH
jgi:hypothetical protein